MQMPAETELPIPKHQEMKGHSSGIVWNLSFEDWLVNYTSQTPEGLWTDCREHLCPEGGVKSPAQSSDPEEVKGQRAKTVTTGEAGEQFRH